MGEIYCFLSISFFLSLSIYQCIPGDRFWDYGAVVELHLHRPGSGLQQGLSGWPVQSCRQVYWGLKDTMWDVGGG